MGSKKMCAPRAPLKAKAAATNKDKANAVGPKLRKTLFWCGYASVILFCIFYIFRGLADAPIFDWDEARHGISAFEMYKNE